MIIGTHETFIGVKVNSIISSEDFVYFEKQESISVPSFYSLDVYSETNAQAP